MINLIRFFIAAAVSQAALQAGPLDWPEIETTHRPGAYWWWPGSAVDKENITANLESMRQAGMGGGTVVALYGVKGYEDRFIDYLSPEWLDMYNHAAEEAERLGMWLDLTPGTAWPFGGPMVSEEMMDADAVYEKGKLSLVSSGRMVKRAAPGGEGYALNPYSPESMSIYLEHFDKAFRAKENVRMPRAFYHDSFEYSGNWSPGLLRAFEELRGYDLEPHLPVLFGKDQSERTARIKSDYRETLSDLHFAYIKTWDDWARSWGATTRNQAHGATGNLLDLYAVAGIPETETFGATPFAIPGVRYEPSHVSEMGPPQPLLNRMASSAANVTGKPLVAAETVTWLRNHFHASLAMAKPEVDQLFLHGINHIFFHGTCYSPDDAPWPGWLFYASFQYNPRNAIWRDAPALNAYIARCQSILQSGEADNDIALYWPIYDIWHDPTDMQQMLTVHHTEWFEGSDFGKTAELLQERGYGFDYISDKQLSDGFGGKYATVVVPRTQRMPVETMESLLKLEKGGTKVLFIDGHPLSVPGFHRWQERESELLSLIAKSKGRVSKWADINRALSDTPAKRERMKRHGLDFIRRSHDEGYHYFIANLGSRVVDRWIRLGTSLKSSVIMDPQTGKTGVASGISSGNQIYLQLQPGETRILRTFTSKKVKGEPWPIYRQSAQSRQIKGEWKVDFIEGEPTLPDSFTTSILGSWTGAMDPETERFSGTARYSIEFDLSAEEADEWALELGDVRESARLRINGEEAGILYSAPFRVEIGSFLRAGRNVLEVEVTNLSFNRIRDLDARGVEWKIFNDINFVDHLYEDYDATKWAPVASGLLGPVTLTPMKKFQPED